MRVTTLIARLREAHKVAQSIGEDHPTIVFRRADGTETTVAKVKVRGVSPHVILCETKDL